MIHFVKNVLSSTEIILNIADGSLTGQLDVLPVDVFRLGPEKDEKVYDSRFGHPMRVDFFALGRNQIRNRAQDSGTGSLEEIRKFVH